MMTIGELKKLIENLDDSTPVLRRTYYGDAIAFREYHFTMARAPIHIVEEWWQASYGSTDCFPTTDVGLIIESPDIGPEPEEI